MSCRVENTGLVRRFNFSQFTSSGWLSILIAGQFYKIAREMSIGSELGSYPDLVLMVADLKTSAIYQILSEADT